MSNGLRFAFVASDLRAFRRSEHASHFDGIKRALTRRGHQVSFFGLETIERAAASANVLVAIGEHASGDRALESSILADARAHTITVFWDLEPTTTLERLHDSLEPLHDLIGRFDVVFTHGGDARTTRDYESFGARSCTAIEDAVDPSLGQPTPSEPRFAADLGMLADHSRTTSARVEEFFVRPARKLPEKSFVLGGRGWRERELPANVRLAGAVEEAERTTFECSVMALLDVSRDDASPRSPTSSPRLFEACGAGACVITDSWEGVESFLAPGREILVAEDGDHVAHILRTLTESRARIIGQNARRRILAHHTYEMRALQVESVLLIKSHTQAKAHGRLDASSVG